MAISLHKKQICKLYKSSLKLAFDWMSDREKCRMFCLAIRKQFDLHKEECNPEQMQLLMDSTRYLLWKYRHPEPYVYPTAPGGVAFDRDPTFGSNLIKNGYNEKLDGY